MSRGQTSRIKLTVPRIGATADEIAREVNRLPLGFCGFTFSRAANQAAASINVWESITLDTVAGLDTDNFLNTAGTSATVNEGAEGVYILSYAARASSGGTGEFRLLVDGVVIGITTLNSTQQFTFVSPPLELKTGAVISWQYRTTNLTAQFVGRTVTSDQTKVPHVSGYRVGLLA